MKYKISEDLLKLREYGRNVQMMVDEAKKIDDDDMRNALVHEIVRIMGSMNPQLRENPDYRQKLWDHFYLLAEFNINVDSEYPMPKPEEVYSRPTKPMEYYDGKPRFRTYGKNVELMVAEALKIDDMDKRLALIQVIANIMRLHLRDDRDSNAELTVMQHLKTLSKGSIDLQPDDIRFYKLPPQQQQPVQQLYRNPQRNKRKKKKKKR